MHIFYKTILPAALLLQILAAGPTGAAEQPATCNELLNQRCTVCHYMTRICQNLGQKSQRQWKKTVKTMKNRGAIISKAELDTLVNCLAGPTTEAEKTCKDYLAADR